jgi:hypothetical protein
MNRSLVRPAACALAAAAFTLMLLAVPASSASAQTITLSGFGCSGTVAWNTNTNTLTCSGSTGSFGCLLSSNLGTSPPLTAAVTLTDSCSGALGSVSYIWSAGSNSTNCPDTPPNLSPPSGTTALSCTYNVTATDSGNNTGSPNLKSIVLNYTAGGSGGGGGGIDTTACTALGLTPKVIQMPWTANTNVYTAQNGNFGPNDAVIVVFTTSSVTTSTATGTINGAEYGGPTVGRSGALSTIPCDFTVGLPKYKLNKTGQVTQCATTVFSGEPYPAASFSLLAQPQSQLTCQAILQPNTTYYWNLTNFSPPPPNGTQGCGQSACNMLMNLKKPTGT